MNTSSITRKAAVAGSFYPGNEKVLLKEINRYIYKVEAKSKSPYPTAYIVPHAGYIYSGQTAAYVYKDIASIDYSDKTFVILGPSHRVYIDKLAIPAEKYFETPLGQIEIDIELLNSISKLPQVKSDSNAHAQEHSIEVQIPFLQMLDSNIKILPICVGQVDNELIVETLEMLLSNSKIILLISSDLSHFLDYSSANIIDSDTLNNILNKTPLEEHERACGAKSINALLSIANKRNWSSCLLDYQNSGDTAGDKNSVVGYGAVKFFIP